MENGKTESIIPLHFARKSTTRSADANYTSWNEVRFIFSLKKKKSTIWFIMEVMFITEEAMHAWRLGV